MRDDFLPDMARFEVTEANWVRAAGLATLGAAEAMSLEAKRADDILMISVWVGEEFYNEERKQHATLTHTQGEVEEGWSCGKEIMRERKKRVGKRRGRF